jgi:predicted anti-sigma-YlaC factor YlaD
MKVRPEVCDRTREYASRRLDGELGELEQRLLGAHLQQCPACREFEAAVSVQAAVLRSQELVPLSYPIEMPRRSRARASLRATTAIAVAGATAVVVLALIQPLRSLDAQHTRAPRLELPSGSSSASVGVERSFWNARRDALKGRQIQPVFRRQVAALP